jgi:phosphoribosylformylglycinamidine synthase I
MKNNSIAYIQFPGSNTENETINTLKRCGLFPRPHLWNDHLDLLDNDLGYVILGGFSFEDRSRSGIIASLEPVVEKLKTQALLGKPVLGICNGAQILVESGMVPGNDSFDTVLALADNKRVVKNNIVGTGYFNTWCFIKPNKVSNSAFIKKGGGILRVPIAHAEGRFIVDKNLQKLVNEKNLISYNYCDKNGEIKKDFPINPNSSFGSAAAISNAAGNVMAMMPHPERCLSGEADDIFEGMKKYAQSSGTFSYQALKYDAQKIRIKKFNTNKEAEVLVSTIIADNEALSVEKCINMLGFDVKIKKYVHYEIATKGDFNLDSVLDTDVLFNPSKEYVADIKRGKKNFTFLVRNRDDIHGKSILQTLQKRFDIKNIETVKRGVVWEIDINSDSPKKDVDLILNSHIFSNPVSQVCHEY